MKKLHNLQTISKLVVPKLLRTIALLMRNFSITIRDSILNRFLRCSNFASKKTKWIKLNVIGVCSEASSLFVLVGNRPAPFAFIARYMAFPNQ